MREGSILVTGATGTVGSEGVKQLSDKGEIIRAAARSPSDNTFRNLNSVRVVQLDYNNPGTLATALKGVEKLFLLTPPQSTTVDFTSNLVREAKESGVKYIVKQSVIGADAGPEIAPTPIRLHRQAEKIIEESKIPFTFLRSNYYMQNFVNFYSHSVKTQGAFYVPAGDARISFVDVRDIAAIAVDSLTSTNGKHEGKAYNITGGEALSHGQAAEILSEQLGRKVDYINVSDDDARKGMKDMGMDEWIINSIIELFEFAKAGHWSAISPVTEQITGSKPISFSQFASDYVVAFK
jgi:uncharacterized protein YbjT (DUF2867 family)